VFLLAFLLMPFLLYAQGQGDSTPANVNLYDIALGEYREGNFQAAVTFCEEQILRNPFDIDAYAVMGWSLIKLGRYEEAYTAAKKGRRLDYNDLYLVEILGEASYFQGRNAEALLFFEEFINLSPDGFRIDTVYYYMSEIFIRQGRFHHADISLSTALHYVPMNADWWIRLGYTRERSGELLQALRAYEKALGVDFRLVDAQRGAERMRARLSR
jgi:tetratricopeptide (TPR) repeat protein